MTTQSVQIPHQNGLVVPSQRDYAHMAREATLIPVYREFISDTITPVAAWLKLKDDSHRFILESVEGGDKLGRYSFVGCRPSWIFQSRGKNVRVGRVQAMGANKNGSAADAQGVQWQEETTSNPLQRLRELLNTFKPADVPGLPRFYGGAVGYLGYDLVHALYDLPDEQLDVLAVPDTYLVISDVILIFDHVQGTLKVVVNTVPGSNPAETYDAAVRTIDDMMRRLSEGDGPSPLHVAPGSDALDVAFEPNMTQRQFEDAVSQCVEATGRGEAEQVVLSQRFDVPMSASPMTLYRVLRTVNPSPYMFCLQFDDVSIVGSSPEVMARVEDGVASVRPIAGTRPRGATDEEDRRLAAELLADDKERMEHEMLLELGRADLMAVCDADSIAVGDTMAIEKYSHVMHIVSHVSGRLQNTKDPIDVLQATFPAGTVSGSPREVAHRMIGQLEPHRRGPYSGAVGYIGFSGNMDTCITIRSAVIKEGMAHIQVGAGIVDASCPKKEYDETLNKAKAMLLAVGIAETASGRDLA